MRKIISALIIAAMLFVGIAPAVIASSDTTPTTDSRWERAVLAGNRYSVWNGNTATSSGNYDMLINSTTSKSIIMKICASAAGTTSYRLYESPTFTAVGNAVPVYNRNRTSTQTTTVAITNSPTVSDPGTQMAYWEVNTKQVPMGECIFGGPIMLNPALDYLIRQENRSGASALQWILLDWIEYDGVVE